MSNYRRYFQTQNSPVFITFVTYDRRNILIDNIDILRNSFKYALEIFNFEIIAVSVLRNHCHVILYAENFNLIPKIIRTIKYNFSVNISDDFKSKNLSQSAIKRGEKGIWQRRYYDHIIRNENDLNRHIDYIHYNSLKHYNILPKDWAFSSFNKFVKSGYYEIEWCNLGDKNQIISMNYE